MTGQHGAVQHLMELGFSQCEAQAYVGLLGREPLTGYALANVTGIRQPFGMRSASGAAWPWQDGRAARQWRASGCGPA